MKITDAEKTLARVFWGPEWDWGHDGLGIWVSDGNEVCCLTRDEVKRLRNPEDILDYLLDYFGFDVICWR